MNKKIRKFLTALFYVLVIYGFFSLFSVALAQNTTSVPKNTTPINTEFGSNPTQPGSVTTLGEYVTNIVIWVTWIGGSLAFLMFIYAGFIYITSQGEPTKLTQAKDIIIGVLVGIVLLFTAGVILNYILPMYNVNY